ncbi:MAG: phosphoglycerate dehydrogenase [Kiritimatiellia bacterium]|jgi:phosphoglycerate dehydrogenase-like enzyme|nr:phosphoglycerate dehydrogenase [Kiritimatiellia bacterium]
MKILVTPRSVTKNGHPSLEALRQAGYEVVFSTPGCFPTENELLELLPGCVGYLAGIEEISAKVLDAATDLKVVGRNGTGVDSIDLDAAERNGIKICRAQGANARGVAELTFAHILSATRSVAFSDGELKKGNWTRRKGIELEGRTLGLVGCGKIGQLVAGFAIGFGMKVIAYDPYPASGFSPDGDFSFCSLEELFTNANVISLHCPPEPGGKPIIDETAISCMKKGVFIINTARGSLLDDDAVLEALESGQIAGVTIDAFESEPPSDWRLAEDPRVTATPHIGGFTEESVARAMTVAVENILAVLQER